MGESSRRIGKTSKYFTKDFCLYGKIARYVTEDVSPAFWEDNSLLGFVRAGTGTLYINQCPYAIRENTLFLVNPFQVFWIEALSQDPVEIDVVIYPSWELVYMDFSEGSVSDIHTYAGTGSPCLCLNEEYARIVCKIFSEYAAECARHDESSHFIKTCKASELFGIIHSLQEERSFFAPSEEAPFCKTVFEYVFLNCRNPLSAKSTAEHFGITVQQLNRELRAVCGEAFLAVLEHARISHAYTMTFRGKIPFQSIAKEAGFASEASFYRAFRSLYGCSPGAYRSRLLVYLYGSAQALPGDSLTEINVYVMENLRAQIRRKDCAEHLFIPESAIESILHKKYGADMGFYELLNAYRLRFAEAMLLTTELSVYEVAFEAGYNSVHTFIRHFKQKNGATPRQYRTERGGRLVK